MSKTQAAISTHTKVIQEIHVNFANKPFALRDIARGANVSTSSVVRALRILQNIRMVSYTKACYAGKHYRVGRGWPSTIEEAISKVEYARILGIAE